LKIVDIVLGEPIWDITITTAKTTLKSTITLKINLIT
jgi:hypothetical protein